MRVLVTGGAGFIGSTIVDALVARGDTVVAIDDLSTGARANVATGTPLRVADVSDERQLRGALREEAFDVVVHAASKTKVVESMEKPDLYRRVIVDGTRNIVKIADELGVRMLVNLSTGGAIYGETAACAAEDMPVERTESHRRAPSGDRALLRGRVEGKARRPLATADDARRWPPPYGRIHRRAHLAHPRHP